MKTITHKLVILFIAISTVTVYSQQVFFFDLNYNGDAQYPTDGNWNNHFANEMETDLTNFINDQGVASTYSFGVTDDFVSANSAGTQTPDASIEFPSSATRDSYYVQDGANETGGFTFSGLNTSMYYHFEIFGSRDGVGDNRETQYTATGANTGVGYLNVSNNTSDTALIQNIQADASGNIVLTVQKGPNNDNGSGFSYIGAIKLSETSELSVKESEQISSINLFPNPVEEQFELSLMLTESANLNIQMYDLTGKLVNVLKDEYVPAGQFNQVWSKENSNGISFAPGYYILKISSGSKVHFKKMIIK